MAPRASAQVTEPEVDLKELVRQIRQNMVEVEREIDQAEAKTAAKASEKTKQDLDELVKRLGQRGQQITTDIDEVIKNIPT
jgi:hypothetical protein